MKWGQEQLVCICSVQTQPLQTTYVGRMECSLFADYACPECGWNVDAELRVTLLPMTSSLLHALVIFVHARDFLPRFWRMTWYFDTYMMLWTSFRSCTCTNVPLLDVSFCSHRYFPVCVSPVPFHHFSRPKSTDSSWLIGFQGVILCFQRSMTAAHAIIATQLQRKKDWKWIGMGAALSGILAYSQRFSLWPGGQVGQ